MNKPVSKQILLQLYPGQSERCGFVDRDGELAEVLNVHPDPANAWRVSTDDIKTWCDKAIGTWHTHPGESANLSIDDYPTFQSWPDWFHLVIGNDGVQAYQLRKGMMLDITEEIVGD